MPVIKDDDEERLARIEPTLEKLAHQQLSAGGVRPLRSWAVRVLREADI